jgi:hypothetical protein
MFADPASLTIGAEIVDVIRIRQDNYSSEYLFRTDICEYRLQIRNTSYPDKKRGVTIDRHNVELVQVVFPVAPSTMSVVRKAYTVIENQQGDALGSVEDLATGLSGFLTGPNILKMLNFES